MKKEYAELRQKYTLPPFATLCAEFHMDDLCGPNLPRKILCAMQEHIDKTKTKIRPALEPDPSSIVGVYEGSELSKDQVDRLFILVKQLSHLERALQVAELGSKTDQAKEINLAFQEWKKIKPKLKRILTILRDAWNNSNSLKTKPNYLQ